jgi:hypothetical protein
MNRACVAAYAPNPSIERTVAGKPAPAAHVERLGPITPTPSQMRPKRTPYSTAAFWVATALGGPFAAAWLARVNRLSQVERSTSGVNQEAVLWLIGVVAGWIAYKTPPDFISQFVSTGLFSFVAVGLWLAFCPQQSDAAAVSSVQASLWRAAVVGLVAKYAVLGALLHVSSVVSVTEQGWARWSQRSNPGSQE